MFQDDIFEVKNHAAITNQQVLSPPLTKTKIPTVKYIATLLVIRVTKLTYAYWVKTYIQQVHVIPGIIRVTIVSL